MSARSNRTNVREQSRRPSSTICPDKPSTTRLIVASTADSVFCQQFVTCLLRRHQGDTCEI
eukprot:6202791-Pleurochrysis_carterae.AAC.4